MAVLTHVAAACALLWWWLRGARVAVWPRKVLHIRAFHVLLGIWYTLPSENNEKRREIRQRIQNHFKSLTGQDEAFVCLSIRTGFDLMLKLLQFPPVKANPTVLTL